MSNLTKVFIVLVTLFAVLLVAVVVTFVASQENFRERYDGLQTRVRIAEATAGSAQSEATAARSSLDEARAAAERQKLDLQRQLGDAQSQLAEQSLRIQTLTTEQERQRIQHDALIAQNNVLAGLTQQQTTELASLREEMGRVRGALIEASDRGAELATQVDLLDGESRHLKEQLASLTDENSRMRSYVRQTGGSIQDLDTTTQPAISTVPIQAQVTAVQQAGTETYVQINVGSRDGVQPTMKFIVFRPIEGTKRFVGSLVIERVDVDSSSGRVTLAQEPVVRGFQVISGMDGQ